MSVMAIPADTMRKMNSMSEENMAIVIEIVNQLTNKPIDIFKRLREAGTQSPMTDEEVDTFIHSVREEQNVISN